MSNGLKRGGAFVGLTLLFVGWAVFALVFIRASTADALEAAAGTPEEKRMSAIEEAKRLGKTEYSYTTGKIPIPLSP